MITIADILLAKHVILDFPFRKPGEISNALEETLRGDERIRDWHGFLENLKQGRRAYIYERDFGIAIPHTRTNHVSNMIIAAGRVREGVQFPDAEAPVHYLFVVGVPTTMASDYLRIIGALTRTFRSPEYEQELRKAPTPQEFIRILSENENPL